MKYILLLSLFSCPTRYTPPEAPKPDVVAEVPVKQPEPAQDYVSITGCTNCTPSQLERIKEAEKLLNAIVKSNCFKTEVLASSFLETDLNPSQVYEKLTRETTTIETETYWTLRRVLGYTLEGVNKVWINRRYMMSWSALDLASLIGHEAAHKKGFGHAFNYYKGRENTVPYRINYIVEKCGGELK